jgi:hypothetical protein
MLKRLTAFQVHHAAATLGKLEEFLSVVENQLSW